jgi:hypothetical protein
VVDADKAGIGSFLDGVLADVPFPLKLATFFGTILVIWGLASDHLGFLLFGAALLFLAIGGYLWSNRYIPYAHKPTRWYTGLRLGNVLFCVVFLTGAALLFYYWAALPVVRATLREAGISR